jgi:hypothetical protein
MDWLQKYLSVPLRQPRDCPKKAPPSMRERIIALLAERPGMTTKTITRFLNGMKTAGKGQPDWRSDRRYRMIRGLLKMMQNEGLIYNIPRRGGNGGRWFVSSRVWRRGRWG